MDCNDIDEIRAEKMMHELLTKSYNRGHSRRKMIIEYYTGNNDE